MDKKKQTEAAQKAWITAGREGLSVREFAMVVNISKSMVQKLCDAGILPKLPDNSIPLEEGKEAYRQYVLQKGDKRTKDKLKTAEKKPKKTNEDFESMAGKGATDNEVFIKARATEKVMSAKLKQLEVQEKTGQLFPREAIVADARHVATEFRSRLLSIAPRIAALCEGRTAREIQRIIEDELNGALEAFQTGAFK